MLSFTTAALTEGRVINATGRVRSRAEIRWLHRDRIQNARSAAREHGHAHDYDIRGLVLSGVFIVNDGGKPVTYRAGDVFNVSAGSSHTEEIGAEGARIVVGRKY